MAHLSGTERSQILLLPEAVDDFVGPDNPVRFIEETHKTGAGARRLVGNRERC